MACGTKKHTKQSKKNIANENEMVGKNSWGWNSRDIVSHHYSQEFAYCPSYLAPLSLDGCVITLLTYVILPIYYIWMHSYLWSIVNLLV